MDKLSPTMQAAVDYAKANGKKIARHQGGFWAKPDWKGPRVDNEWFGTTTIQALVSRGVFEYSAWRERRGGGREFPIEVILAEKSEPIYPQDYDDQFITEQQAIANEQYQNYLRERGITEEEHLVEVMDWCDRQD